MVLFWPLVVFGEVDALLGSAWKAYARGQLTWSFICTLVIFIRAPRFLGFFGAEAVTFGGGGAIDDAVKSTATDQHC